MRVLVATEGTYPFNLGGVSTWCDQLLRGLPQHEFDILAVTGPNVAEPTFPRPDNARSLRTLPIWRPPEGLHRATGHERSAFLEALEGLLSFARLGGLETLLVTPDGRSASAVEPGAHAADVAFADGLYTLALLGSRVQLWPLFEDPSAWALVRTTLRTLTGRDVSVWEAALASQVLRATLVPVLVVPAPADIAQTIANGLAAIPAYAAARYHRIPLMLTEHGVYLRERYLAFASENDPPSIKLLRARFHRALATLIYTRADTVVSVSEFNRRWQIELGAAPERTRVIYNGVVPDAFPPASYETRATPTVAWVGRVDPLKDLGTLIDAFDRVRRSLHGAVLRLFGPVPFGNEAYHRELLRMIERLDVRGAVRFEGALSPVYPAYHAGDVVALSSVSEAFPYVPIEAMMCGRAVVATRVGGVPEAVSGVGRLVSPRAPDELADALGEILGDEGLRRELGMRGRAVALERFTIGRMLASYDAVYTELTSANHVFAERRTAPHRGWPS